MNSSKISLPKEISTDLVVIGGGLAGCFAAIAAKRTNPQLDVWLIERYGFLGGMATAGYVFPMMGYSAWDPAQRKIRRLSGGLFQELLQLMHDSGYTESFGSYYKRFDCMMMRCVLDRMIEQAHVNVLFHALMNRVEKQQQIISKLFIQTKAGELAINTRTVIDCSGDADVIFHAGGLWEMGRIEDGLTQPATLNFRLGNIGLISASRRSIAKKVQAAIHIGKSLDFLG